MDGGLGFWFLQAFIEGATERFHHPNLEGDRGREGRREEGRKKEGDHERWAGTASCAHFHGRGHFMTNIGLLEENGWSPLSGCGYLPSPDMHAGQMVDILELKSNECSGLLATRERGGGGGDSNMGDEKVDWEKGM